MPTRPKPDPAPTLPETRTGVVSATEAKNKLGQVLAQAMREGVVYITRHDKPEVAVLSMDRYRELAAREEPALDELTREFDALLAHMQTDEAAAAADALFEMDSEDLGEAAVLGARRKSD